MLPAKPILRPEVSEHDGILTSFLPGLLEPLKNILTECVKWMFEYLKKKWGDDICNSLGDNEEEALLRAWATRHGLVFSLVGLV